jgi:hypothetical protein
MVLTSPKRTFGPAKFWFGPVGVYMAASAVGTARMRQYGFGVELIAAVIGTSALNAPAVTVTFEASTFRPVVPK